LQSFKNKETDQGNGMTEFTFFILGMFTMLILIKGAQVWISFRKQRNNLIYSKALKRSLKKFDPFSPI
jgi:hypothetical protein